MDDSEIEVDAWMGTAGLEHSRGRLYIIKGGADRFFEIQTFLGRGVFAVVDEVRSRSSLRYYVQKLVFRHHASSPRHPWTKGSIEYLSGVLTELSHRHVVRLIGSYTDKKYFGLLVLLVADMDPKDFLERDLSAKAKQAKLKSFFVFWLSS